MAQVIVSGIASDALVIRDDVSESKTLTEQGIALVLSGPTLTVGGESRKNVNVPAASAEAFWNAFDAGEDTFTLMQGDKGRPVKGTSAADIRAARLAANAAKSGK